MPQQRPDSSTTGTRRIWNFSKIWQQSSDARLRLNGHRRTRHGFAHSGLFRVFACGHHSARDVAIGDHANGFHVVVVFDYGNLAAVVLYHYLARLLHIMFRRTASGIAAHNVFGLFHGLLPWIAIVSNASPGRNVVEQAILPAR